MNGERMLKDRARGPRGAVPLRPKQRSLEARRLGSEKMHTDKFVKGLELNIQEHPNFLRSANSPLKKLSVRHRRTDGFDLAASRAKSKKHPLSASSPSLASGVSGFTPLNFYPVKPVYLFCLTGACKRQRSGFNWGASVVKDKRGDSRCY